MLKNPRRGTEPDVCRGGYSIFQKVGLRPAIRKAGGRGGGGGGGGAVRFRPGPDTKSGGGEGGGCVLSASGPVAD